MDSTSSFAENAKGFSRNPLGIIALFIVLVYAVASCVIMFGGDPFYKNATHPAVLFLVIFPIIVLAVFFVLVAFFHQNLYAPEDFKNQEHFFFRMKVPRELPSNRRGAATSDDQKIFASETTKQDISSAYQQWTDVGLALIHLAEINKSRTDPKTGRYLVRLWVESFGSRDLKEISEVTYHLWSDFSQPIRTTASIENNFDLWLSVYGEFPVLAIVKFKDGQDFKLQRYIDLPGRPQD